MSLVPGVAAAGAGSRGILVAGVAGLVAGSMSMAAGEYVAVSSQADTESADLGRQRQELAAGPREEHAELAAIHVSRGLDPALASSVLARATSRASVAGACRHAGPGPRELIRHDLRNRRKGRERAPDTFPPSWATRIDRTERLRAHAR